MAKTITRFNIEVKVRRSDPWAFYAETKTFDGFIDLSKDISAAGYSYVKITRVSTKVMLEGRI